MSTERERVIAGATDPVVRTYLRMADDSIVAVLPFALSLAARLGVADECAGPALPVPELAERVGAAPDPLARLLRALAGCGFFQEDSRGRFALTPLGEILRTGSPVSMRETLRNLDSQRAWLEAVDRPGAPCPAFDGTFGTSFFAHKEKDTEAGAAFDLRMRERAERLYSGLAALRVWRELTCVLDVGGGTGTVLASLLAAHTGLRGILLDRPDVVARASAPGPLDACRDRLELAGGDFFDRLPGGADAHLLCSVLHDWDDERALALLDRSVRALRPGGRVLVCEMVAPDSPAAHPAPWSDLGMLVLLGGRERTLAQYRDLLFRAGLRIDRVTPLPDSPFSVIEARRAQERS
ncbi:methyltransferase [Streptomyces ziwulingensis]|uniref:Methyltransferase n=1 Tax=Streptomyces ziwulingensis TaxID=1045501 RepID=A0ABP9D2V3_9ACTN